MSGTEGFKCVLHNHITCYVSIYVHCTIKEVDFFVINKIIGKEDLLTCIP